MKKILLFLSFILLLQTNAIVAQTIDLPPSLYLCDTGSLELDGTVINTTDTNITYQWYYGLTFDSATEIEGENNSTLILNGALNEAGL